MSSTEHRRFRRTIDSSLFKTAVEVLQLLDPTRGAQTNRREQSTSSKIRKFTHDLPLQQKVEEAAIYCHHAVEPAWETRQCALVRDGR